MNMKWVKLAIGALAGCGIGFIIGKRKVVELEARRDTLIEHNKHLQTMCDDLRRNNENLKEANRLKTKLLTEEES